MRTCLEPASRLRDRNEWRHTIEEFEAFTGSAFAEKVSDFVRISELVAEGYLSTEADLQRRAAVSAGSAARRGVRRGRPEAPPPRLPAYALPALSISFGRSHPEPTSGSIVAERFFVRTLTRNDINKLRGHTPGTCEWDLGETARNQNAPFWGWPNEYEHVEYRKGGKGARFEWATQGRLVSSQTAAAGVPVTVKLWFRPARPDHAAEHRLSIQPAGELRAAVPADFNLNGLLLVERLPPGEATFLVRFISEGESEYDDYASYLTVQNPHHRYGYGP